MRPNHVENGPSVSVIMTLLYHRGHVLEALQSWARQTYPRERLELVIVSNGREPRIEEQVRKWLGASDTLRSRLLRFQSDNEMELYDFVARQANGQWLLFTEPHCVAEPDCVAELIGTLNARDFAGGCVRTLSDQSRQWVARIEEQMSREAAAVWTREGDWRKFTKRGFALRADVYRAVGGLPHRYRRFAESVIAARLDAQGYRLAYVPSAAVKHFNSTDLRDLLEYVWEYRGKLRAFLDETDNEVRPYFVAAATESSPPPKVVMRATQRAICSTLWAGLRHGLRRGSLPLAVGMLRAGANWQLRSQFAGRALPALRYGLARLRLAWPWQSEDRRYQAFRDVWDQLGDWSAATCQPCRADLFTNILDFSQEALHPCDPIEILPSQLAHGWYGFHASEAWEGDSFRWTEPVASLVLSVLPEDYDVELDTHGLRSVSHARTHVFWNGHGTTPVGDAAFRIRRSTFVSGAPQVLTITCRQLHARDQRERRTLGLPLFRLRFRSGGLRKCSARPLSLLHEDCR